MESDKQSRIDQLVEKPTEASAYHINQSCPILTQTQPITVKDLESEEDDHQTVENSNKKKAQTSRSKLISASSSRHYNRSTNSKPLRRKLASRRSNTSTS